jgi:nucleoid-associated protein EbfC
MSPPFGFGGMFDGMREKLERMEQQLAHRRVEAMVGGGAVVVTANAKGEVIDVRIDPAALDDVAVLQDFVVAAVNEALARGRAMAQEELQQTLGPMAGLLSKLGGQGG